MVDIASAMERMNKNQLVEKVVTVARLAIDERLAVMEQQQDKLARLTAKLTDTLDVADRAAAIVVAKMGEQKQDRWISIETAMPEPNQWYIGLVIQQEKDFNTGGTTIHYRLIRGYPNKLTPPKDLFPEMRFWFPLPSPVGLASSTINETEVAKTKKENAE